METWVYGSMRDEGLEVIRRDGRLYVRYDAGAHAAMWREDEITEEELHGLMGGISSSKRTMLEIQRRLIASGVDAYAANWRPGE